MKRQHLQVSRLTLATMIALFLVVGVPLLNVTGVVSDFNINLWGKYLCYGLMAISVDLLWGYTGLLSLGQALFFSLGGYMLGMNLMLMIGKDGQYYKSGNNPNLLPDFMVFLGHTDLPSCSGGPSTPSPSPLQWWCCCQACWRLSLGYLAFRSRIKGVYFSILTQALTYAARLPAPE